MPSTTLPVQPHRLPTTSVIANQSADWCGNLPVPSDETISRAMAAAGRLAPAGLRNDIAFRYFVRSVVTARESQPSGRVGFVIVCLPPAGIFILIRCAEHHPPLRGIPYRRGGFLTRPQCAVHHPAGPTAPAADKVVIANQSADWCGNLPVRPYQPPTKTAGALRRLLVRCPSSVTACAVPPVNYGMIATGNHWYFDSLRGAPPPRGRF